jgi:hypothetical protein
MKIKLVTIFVCMLLFSITFSINVIAGSEEDPEIQDRTRDVKLFGLFPFMPQFNLIYADIVSAWICEEEENPDLIYMNLKIRDLDDTTEKYDAIYVISWTYENVHYSASMHIFPHGPTSLKAGPIDEERNDYINFVVCEGNIDSTNDIITWIIPKDAIGNPSTGLKITNIVPHTHLRYPEYSVIPMWDLFKDLPWNALSNRDYIIKY